MKNLSNLGKSLNKAEQQSINGGIINGGCYRIYLCDGDCSNGSACYACPPGGSATPGTMSNGRCCV